MSSAEPSFDIISSEYKSLKSSDVPQILTHTSKLPALDILDAGDLVECYTLTRKAKLKNVLYYRSNKSEVFSSSDNLSNSCTNSNISSCMKNDHRKIRVQKSAVAFRYKPKSKSLDSVNKHPFEITLEYGPQRTGPRQSMESMPIVNGHFRDNFVSEDGEDGAYLSWENDAKIYYDLSISRENWQDAHYMASITGAVLTKIMDFILDYPNRHPRYQPFMVVSKGSGAMVLKSSSSEDFVWNVFVKLAEMYVDIEPVLSPLRHGVRFFVEDELRDVEKLSSHTLLEKINKDFTDKKDKKYNNGIRNVANAAAKFYQNFYKCVSAIKSGNYSAFKDDVKVSNESFIMLKTVNYDISNSGLTRIDKNITNDISQTDIISTYQNYKMKEISGYTVEIENNNDMNFQHPNNSRAYFLPRSLEDVDEAIRMNNSYDFFLTRKLDILSNKNKLISAPEHSIVNRYIKFSESADPFKLSFHLGHGFYAISYKYANEAKIAADAAEKLAEAATEAAKFAEDDKVAAAATAAADLAKIAAEQTSEAAATNAMLNLLSGDGSLVTSILSTCFSDPKYKIRKENGLTEGTKKNDSYSINHVSTTHAYLYIDGTNYYRLNLTPPYWDSIAVFQEIPKPQVVPDGSGDIIDWSLALVIIGCLFLGILVMFHHMGMMNIDSRLQCRNFFHSTHSLNYPKKNQYMSSGLLAPSFQKCEKNSDSSKSSKENKLRDENVPCKFVDDETYNIKCYEDSVSKSRENQEERFVISGDFDVQLKAFANKTSHVESLNYEEHIEKRESSNHNYEKVDKGHTTIVNEDLSYRNVWLPSYLGIGRDPDLVDFPDFRSSSKVAIPPSSTTKRDVIQIV